MAEIRLAEDGERVLREAERMCYATNVAITAPEHLLAAALSVLTADGAKGLPAQDGLENGVLAIHGMSDEPISGQVMWGSAAREGLNATARAVAEAGQSVIDARRLALGLMDSGEVNPMFYGAMGTTKDAIRAALGT